jgi:sortase A
MSLARCASTVVAAALFAGGIAAVGYVAYVMVDARAYQTNERARFAQALRTAPAVHAPAAVGLLANGSVIGEITIARVALSAIVAQGDSAGILQRAVGHLRETALPGQRGNVVLAAHRDTFFRPLEDVRVGDAITLRTLAGEFVYLVEWIAVVRPNELHVIAPTDHDTLTLITCFPFAYIGAAPDRFVVRARATSSAGAGVPSATPRTSVPL